MSYRPVMPTGNNVRQLRVVVVADDYDAAVTFYRDRLGMPEVAAYAQGGDDRVAILDAGRATLEIASATHARTIDVAEADGLESPRVRLAFEVEDTSALTDRLVQDGGVELLAAAVLTPWRSVNSRLAAPADQVITLFQETEGLEERAQREGFGRDTDR